MNSGRSGTLQLATLLLALAQFAQAQPSAPRIGYVYPAGGRQGATIQVVVGGQFLNNTTNVFIVGDGIRADFVEFSRPMSQKEFGELRDQWRALQERRRDHFQNKQTTNRWTGADEEMMADVRMKLLKNPPNRTAAPAIAETVILNLAIATNAEPGDREIRLAAPNGLSNPLKFWVGKLPEFSGPRERAPNPELDRLLGRLGQSLQTNSVKAAMRVTLPAVINGQIAPGAQDRFRFAARQGQRIVVAVSARDLIPYLADAVPGWFQAVVTISDAKGRELACDRHFRFRPDPVLSCEIPRDGDYVLEIHDSIYRGREDFVYRIAVGELPFVTHIFPLGGTAGGPTGITLAGWNLSVTNLTLDTSNQPPRISELVIGADEGLMNRIPFAVDALPETGEQESNDDPVSAQHLVPPMIVNGRIEKPGDTDIFSFQGQAGGEVVAAVLARRLNSPVDSTLELTDVRGDRIAFNDDCGDQGSGLETHHADSYLRAVLPSSGRYFVRLADAQRQGGDAFGYRLRISAPQPDFALRVTPSSVSVRAGDSVPLTIHVLRQDGFTNAVSLRLKDAPDGWFVGGAVIPANQDRIRITLTAPNRPGRRFRLEFEGRAEINGKEVVRAAVPAEDMMQAFAYRHLVPAKELSAAVGGSARPAGAIRISGATPVRISPGGRAKVRVAGAGSALANRFKFELSEPPEGISLGNIRPTSDGLEMELIADPKVNCGLTGNLIVNLFAERARAQTGPAPPNARRVAVNVLPAIPFEVVAE